MQGALKIGRLRAECSVSGTPESAPKVVDRATRALRYHLPGTLRTVFARWLDREDESVWIVRRIDLSVLAAADAPPDVLATSVATSLGRALGESLIGDGDGVNAIRFPNRAGYLAQFLVDAAAGDARRRWYHAAFAGLRLLTSSATIRTVLVDDPPCGRAALASLDDAALARVTSALTAADERRVLDAFGGVDAASSALPDHAFAAAWDACAKATDGGVAGGLALFTFVRSDSRMPAPALARAARLVVEARNAARAATAPRGREVADAPLPGLPLSTMRAIRAHVATQRGALTRTHATTALGGLFLLLRDLRALPWAAWTAGWPASDAGAAPAVLEWLALAACAGRDGGHAFEDGVLRALYGVPPTVRAPDVGRWLRAVGTTRRRTLERDIGSVRATSGGPTAAARAWLTPPRTTGIARGWSHVLASIAFVTLRRFAQRLPGFSASTPQHLWRSFLAFRATVTDDGDQLVVRCGRPPLHLVLMLTGMTRELTVGHDAHGRPIRLFPED